MTQAWDPSHLDTTGNLTLSGSPLLTATRSSAAAAWRGVYAINLLTTGKYYFEINITAGSRGFVGVGNANAIVNDGGAGNDEFPGKDANGIGLDTNTAGTGFVYVNVAVVSTIAVLTGPVFGCAVDLTNHLIWWKNVTANGSFYGSSTSPGDPAAGAGGATIPSSVYTGGVSPGASLLSANQSLVAGFAESSWVGTAPVGFSRFDIGPFVTSSAVGATPRPAIWWSGSA